MVYIPKFKANFLLICLAFIWLGILNRIYWSSLDHDLTASIWEKAISILAGNLNSGRIYIITTVPKQVRKSVGRSVERRKPQCGQLFINSRVGLSDLLLFEKYCYYFKKFEIWVTFLHQTATQTCQLIHRSGFSNKKVIILVWDWPFKPSSTTLIFCEM